MSNEIHATATTRVALIGAGRVGTSVATLLKRSGSSIVGVASRSPRSAEAAAAQLEAPVFDLAEGGWPPSDLVLIGVTDPALEEMASRLAAVVEPGTIVCHFAGSHGVRPLSALARAGARVCAMHPVQACPSIEAAVRRLPGSFWGVTCDDDLYPEIASLIQESLRGHPVRLDEAVRPLWHAAAVTASNGLGALLAAAEAILASIGVSSPEAVLGPLAAGTLANALEGGGGAAALTGPVVRGDIDTIRRHLDALREHAPGLLEAYRLGAELVFVAASASGRLDLDQRLSLGQVLEAR